MKARGHGRGQKKQPAQALFERGVRRMAANLGAGQPFGLQPERGADGCSRTIIRREHDRERRIEQASATLPELVRAAVAIHGKGPAAKMAALCAWTNLAGVVGWCPEMIERVEEEMRRDV